jgi:hypothetical protein
MRSQTASALREGDAGMKVKTNVKAGGVVMTGAD